MTRVDKIGQIAQRIEIRPHLWLKKTEAQALEEILKLCTRKFQKNQSSSK